ncbi:membrane lipoprotein lipid attachment site-containing protein [Candidatus Woesearchaeota archaeon]|nr:membrane lipoprotein lipid attachment site-containing protein [Candidatus Woesearchaeota archaeon]
MKKIILLVFAVLLVSGCASQVYQNQAATPRVQTNSRSSSSVNYKTHSTSQFTLTHPDEWLEPKHYSRDYYYYQLADFVPYVHLSVFDIEEFTNTTDYYETMSELFYLMFDYQEIDHQITEDTMIMSGKMIDEENDELITTYKVVVCPDVVLALDVSGLSEEYDETKEMFDTTINSFRCS